MVKITDDILRCPTCGNNYLHHTKVDVFERDMEDCQTGIHANIIGANILIDRYMIDNPSSRRDGIRVLFKCENCEREPMLLISQHKGNTYITFS